MVFEQLLCWNVISQLPLCAGFVRGVPDVILKSSAVLAVSVIRSTFFHSNTKSMSSGSE